MTTHAIQADNVGALRSFAESFLRAFGGRVGAPYLEITMPCCGERKVYKREADVPESDVGPCPCGNFFIKYK